MGSFISSTEAQREKMLRECGYSSMADLFEDVPAGVRLEGGLDIPEGCSEMEASQRLQALADENVIFRSIFRGAGSYNHYIPAIVKSVTSKEEFVTAYTPYQPEISQGVLQSIFEYQSMICSLTGMETSNASVYDGATAAAEAVMMCRERRRDTVYVSETTDPQVLETIKTYCYGRNIRIVCVPQKDGATDGDALEKMLDDSAACFYVQYPNYYGIIEDCGRLGEITHSSGAKFVMGCNPIALAMLRTPGELGADIAVGEGQPLGLPMGFGGPYLGYMAATKDMMRKLPGRIVGQTEDHNKNRCYVLTLQAREQHIRREKAGSNVCSNEALCAMTAAVYMSAMGAEGMRDVASLCTSKAHYLQKRLAELGFEPVYNRKFFHEFVTTSPIDTGILEQKLAEKGFLCGLRLENNRVLWCTTEKNSRADIDMLCAGIKEVCGLEADI